jgi:hypothetical protein
MDTDIILGCLICVSALAALTVLVFWCRRRIDRIADRGSTSAREILQDMRRGG